MKPSAIILSMTAAGSATNHTQAFVSPSSFSSTRATARSSTPPEPALPRDPAHSSSPLRMVATASPPEMKEEIYAMRVKDIRRELESYGVSTESIFEKKELTEALMKARREEKIPVGDWNREESVPASRDESGGSNGSGPVDGDDASMKNGWFRKMVDRFAGWDPSYRDVVVTKFDADFLDGIVIDV